MQAGVVVQNSAIATNPYVYAICEYAINVNALKLDM